MSDNKKYYYLKLKEDFFDNEEMKILESMKNGIEYQNVYLKMCLLSLKSDGALLFKNMLPYSLEMLSSVLRVNIDTVKTAVEIFQKIGLVTVTDTETIYMTDIQSLVGQSSTEAERVRKYRQNLAQKKQELPEEDKGVQMYENCTENVQKCTPEIRDKSIEIRDKNLESNSVPKLTDFTNIQEDKSANAESEHKTKHKFAYSIYTNHHFQIYNELKDAGVIANKPIDYNYGLIAKRIKTLLSNPFFTEDKILQGITNAKNDSSCIKNGFLLEQMLTEANMTRLINKCYITTSNPKSNYQKKHDGAIERSNMITDNDDEYKVY